MKDLSKAELTLLNKVLGFIQDVNDKGDLPDHAAEVVDSDEFNELNEKIAELIA